MSRYKIKILTLQEVTLHFTVSKYDLKSNPGFIGFTDEKTGRKLTFPIARCEIEEVSYE